MRRLSGSLLLFSTVILIGFATPALKAERVTSPLQQFGFNIGDDYCLVNYTQLAEYWHKLDKESSRIKVVEFGKSEEGRSMFMAIITSPSNQRRLAHYQQIARKLALAEGLTDKEAKSLAAEGKAVVWIDGGLHASETLGSQQLVETVYQLVSGKDAETERFLNDTIVLAIPCNPDGIELVGNWYMRESDPKKRSLTGLPRLYQKYIGHDDNRDFFAVTQSETKAMNRVMYREWYPQIVYNHHQSGPPGTVLFCPPFRDPYNYNVDPMVINGIDMVGANMMNRFLVEGKPGATVRSGSRYSTWWNGGLRTTCYFHNMIGLLTESIGNPTPSQIPLLMTQQLPRADLLAPIAPQTWHMRQSVDYSVTANKSVLDFASKHRTELLYNIYQMGRRAIERGGLDSWTISPKRLEHAKSNQGNSRGAATAEYKRLFQPPEFRDPRAYILPSDQVDFLTATKFVNTMIETGIKVHRATHDFEVGGKKYPAGSYVFSCAQAFRAHVVDMFEPQDHPNDFAYPGAAPTPPYDIAGWTLAFQMGLKFDRVFERIPAVLEELKNTVPPPLGTVTAGKAGYFLSAQINDSFRAVNRLLAAGVPVRRLTQALTNGTEVLPAGTFYIPATPNAPIYSLALELGVSFHGTSVTPTVGVEDLRRLRVGLWDRYGGSMPSGWTRWLLEKFEYPFEVVFPPTLDAGKLRDKFDVLIFVDGAIPARTNATTTRGTGTGTRTARTAEAPTGDQPASESGEVSNIPAEYSGRRGAITAAKTIPQLKQFMQDGGTILTIGSSTSLAGHLGLPLASKLVEVGKDGKETALPREKYYVPGSVLRTRVDTSHPLAWGLGEDVDVMFSNSPTFRMKAGMETNGLACVGWFDSATPLRSGWAWGQQYLENGITVAEAAVGKGRLVLFGPEILFRAQPHGTFKFLFNGILRANSPENVAIKSLTPAE